MSTLSPDVEIQLLKQWQLSVDARMLKAESDVEALRRERNTFLMGGIITLGGSVIGLFFWIAKMFLEGKIK